MLEQITDALKANKEISAWQVNRVNTRSNQLFMIKEEVESVRRVDTVKYYVTVHRLHDEGGKQTLGESSFTFIEGEDVHAKLALALEMAGRVANQPWTLPAPGQFYMGSEIKDAAIALSPDKIIDKVKEEVLHSVGSFEGVRLSSVEVFADFHEFELINSLGLTAKAADTKMLFDFVMLAGEAHAEVESSGFKEVRFYKDLRVRETLKKYAGYAHDSLVARLPETGKFDVVFGEEALDTLFATFVAHSGGGSAYQGWSRFSSGNAVIAEPEGETLSLFSNPQIPGGMKSGPYDEFGLATKRVEVIGNNVFKKRTLDKRYSDYLGEEATGAFSNVEVGTGGKTSDELLTEGCYHLLRFSTFEPNPVTGNFSGEIRTGYKLAGGKRVPIKGGSVQGEIFDAFRRAWFSSDKAIRAAYKGPAAVKLAGLDMAGE